MYTFLYYALKTKNDRHFEMAKSRSLTLHTKLGVIITHTEVDD